MDPVTALSLAGNIAQFIGIAIKLTKTTGEIYNSQKGETLDHHGIALMSSRLGQLASILDATALKGKDSSQWTSNERALVQIAAQCQSICSELENTLRQLLLGDKRRKWRSFELAIRSSWKEDEIKSTVERLLQLKSELDTHLLAILVQRQTQQYQDLTTKVDRSQAEILRAISALQGTANSTSQGGTGIYPYAVDVEMQNKMHQLELLLVDRLIRRDYNYPGAQDVYVESEKQAVAAIVDFDTSMRRKHRALRAASNKPQESRGNWISRAILPRKEVASDSLTTEAQHLKQMHLELRAAAQERLQLLEHQTNVMLNKIEVFNTKWQETLILESLKFTAINDRRDEMISAPHEATFAWIYDTESTAKAEWDPFPTWLTEQSTSVYWIAGKPGSGKSTLMRYLWQDPRTSDLLHQWSQDHKLVIGSCFFWNAGSDLQKSLVGMLRTLLVELLSQLPSLTTSVAPHRSRALECGITDYGPWFEPELLDTFDQLMTLLQDEAYVFLLIDGLDEFEGTQAERHRVNGLLTQVALLPHVKVCVSSRPWPIFEDAFEDAASLRVEKMTRQDIKDFVEAEFVQDRRFQALRKAESEECDKLIVTLLDMAQGVFLWVKLVVLNLIESLQDDFRVSDLFKHLRKIPDDLNDYFQHILDSISLIEEKNREEAAKLFRVMIAQGELSLMTLSFIDEEDIHFAQKADEKDYKYNPNTAQIEAMHRGMTKRIKSRCKELIETYEARDSTIISRWRSAFLHRTVRDFLQQEEIQQQVRRFEPPGFSPAYYVFQAAVQQILFVRTSRWSDVVYILGLVLTCAFECEAEFPSHVLEQLRRVEELLYRPHGHYATLKKVMDNQKDTCSNLTAVEISYGPTPVSIFSHPFGFVREAARFRIRGFVLTRMMEDPRISKAAFPGEYFNDLVVKQSVSFLRYALVPYFISAPDRQHNLDVIALCLAHGADPNERVSTEESLWSQFVRGFPHCNEPPEELTIQICELFIRAGAERYTPGQLRTRAVGGKIQRYVVDGSQDDICILLENKIGEPHGRSLADLLRKQTSWRSRWRAMSQTDIYDRLRPQIIPSPAVDEAFRRDAAQKRGSRKR